MDSGPNRQAYRLPAAAQETSMCKPGVKCVLLAERHHGLTEGIRGVLQTAFDPVMMVADAKSLFEGAERLQPALAVVELSLSRDNGLELLVALRARCPGLKVIVLSMHTEPTLVGAVLEAGAQGYVLTSALGTDLLAAVEAVLAGGRFVLSSVPRTAAEPGTSRKEPG